MGFMVQKIGTFCTILTLLTNWMQWLSGYDYSCSTDMLINASVWCSIKCNWTK